MTRYFSFNFRDGILMAQRDDFFALNLYLGGLVDFFLLFFRRIEV
jgi:hypothetical protein